MSKIRVGDTASYTKTITESDVYGFAELSGDYNDLHVDRAAAEKGPFGGRIAHGMLVGSLISTVLGTRLPGNGTIDLEQHLKFKKPVYIGDTVTAAVTVAEILNKKKGIMKLDTVITNQRGETVIEAYDIIMYKEP